MPMVAPQVIPAIKSSSAVARCRRPDEKLATRHFAAFAQFFLTCKQVVQGRRAGVPGFPADLPFQEDLQLTASFLSSFKGIDDGRRLQRQGRDHHHQACWSRRPLGDQLQEICDQTDPLPEASGQRRQTTARCLAFGWWIRDDKVKSCIVVEKSRRILCTKLPIYGTTSSANHILRIESIALVVLESDGVNIYQSNL
eukprot:CAMPEP_0181525544 /NCGR_PEP_ID=MMETSP1110-20121109/69022_1 /TAXON_ID=174948 /ORGANISM="Symbiodinium sp., Strain CCMP421" /LENGTH=196 /DNA_ID=CAMNT_0023656351 /DNA_START=121 /DNA_END=711 /DNA_ORIENTATION=-